MAPQTPGLVSGEPVRKYRCLRGTTPVHGRAISSESGLERGHKPWTRSSGIVRVA